MEPKRFTIEPVQAGEFSNLQPEFIRVPDAKRLFGVKRGILYRWIGERRVKSILLREPGNQQGIRLIHYDSLKKYLYSQMEIQEGLEKVLAA